MKFYKENKVNPFASCLPLLLQLPVFLALFFLLNGDEFKDAGARRRAERTSCSSTTSPRRRRAPTLIVLMVLFVGSQMASTLVMSVTADKTQQRIMLLLPLVFAALHPELPGRPDRLLDHDQLLDPGPAARGAAGWRRRPSRWCARWRRPPRPAGGATVRRREGRGAGRAPKKAPPPPPRRKKRRRRWQAEGRRRRRERSAGGDELPSRRCDASRRRARASARRSGRR